MGFRCRKMNSVRLWYFKLTQNNRLPSIKLFSLRLLMRLQGKKWWKGMLPRKFTTLHYYSCRYNLFFVGLSGYFEIFRYLSKKTQKTWIDIIWIEYSNWKESRISAIRIKITHLLQFFAGRGKRMWYDITAQDKRSFLVVKRLVYYVRLSSLLSLLLFSL